MDTHFVFTSSLFSATAGELDKNHVDYINPYIYAKELADFLEKNLKTHGYSTRFRCAEDWGQWLEIEQSGNFALAVCCANTGEIADGLAEHRVFITPDKPIIRKLFRKIDVSDVINALGSTIRKILEEERFISTVNIEE